MSSEAISARVPSEPTAIHPRDSSSETTHIASLPRPMPPHCSGRVSENTPSSAHAACIGGELPQRLFIGRKPGERMERVLLVLDHFGGEAAGGHQSRRETVAAARQEVARLSRRLPDECRKLSECGQKPGFAGGRH